MFQFIVVTELEANGTTINNHAIRLTESNCKVSGYSSDLIHCNSISVQKVKAKKSDYATAQASLVNKISLCIGAF